VATRERRKFTLEFKREAVKLVDQRIAWWPRPSTLVCARRRAGSCLPRQPTRARPNPAWHENQIARNAADRNMDRRHTSRTLESAEKATWMAGEAIRVLGGNDRIHDYPVDRLWRDARLDEIGARTGAIRRMLIGRELFSETTWKDRIPCRRDDHDR
jgi:hypothetical protein